MCLPAVAAVAGLAGSAVSAMGAKSQADAAANQAEYNAQVARINAQSERYKGGVEQERIGQRAFELREQGIAAAGASGVDPFFGSAAQVIFGEGGEKAAQDKNTAYINAEGAAVGHENKARDLEAQAKAQRKAGSIAAGGTFLSGIAGAASGYARSSLGQLGGLPSLGGGNA